MNRLWEMTTVLIALSTPLQAAYMTIGEAGNTADTSGYGAVNYEYKISDHEVTIAEFNASGAGDGDEGYWNDGTRTVGVNAPAVNISWYEAVKYCNWLTSGDVYLGAYTHDGGGAFTGIDRAAAIATHGTVYVLPTEDEWYKAAYWTGNESDPWSLYANGTDTTPTWGTTNGWNYYNGEDYAYGGDAWPVGYGAQEQNGTYDMMGNVWEWTETMYDASRRVGRGGGYGSNSTEMNSSVRGKTYPYSEGNNSGFRVVMIPEPSTMLLFGLGGIGAFLLRRSRKKTDECDE
jgi:formylglycine-generating enzyme required for sulfatase activity